MIELHTKIYEEELKAENINNKRAEQRANQ